MGVVESLHAEMSRGPVAAALASRSAVALDASSAAAIADNPDLDMTVRIAALLAIALVAQDGVAVPDTALSALEDDTLVDAVLANAASSALTGLLFAAQGRVSDQLRRYLALRIAAAGATGVHVADLLVAVGDAEGAVRAVVPTLIATLRETADDDPVTLALATIVHDWTRTNASIDVLIEQALPELQRKKLAQALAHVVTAR
jgi:hypothetical protein